MGWRLLLNNGVYELQDGFGCSAWAGPDDIIVLHGGSKRMPPEDLIIALRRAHESHLAAYGRTARARRRA